MTAEQSEHQSLGEKVRTGLVAAALVVLPLGLGNIAMAYKPGPWWLWATDACPSDPNMACGMIPMGPFLVGGLGFVVVGAAIWVITDG